MNDNNEQELPLGLYWKGKRTTVDRIVLPFQSLEAIEDPYIPTLDEVRAWANHIAYCQFTEAEMRDGTAWRILNDA